MQAYKWEEWDFGNDTELWLKISYLTYRGSSELVLNVLF